MASNRDLCINDAAYQICTLFAALDLHRFGTAFLHKTRRVTDGLFHADVIRAVWHVGEKKGILHTTTGGASVVKHLVDSDGERVVISEHSLSERVAYQHDIDARFINQACSGIVVSGEAADRFAVKLLV